MTDWQRHIELQGAKNFRDFGGYAAANRQRVKKQTLYRSDSLAALTDEDLQHLSTLNICTICDTRRPGEARHSPSRWYAGASTVVHHLPFYSDQGTAGKGDVMRRASAVKSAEGTRQIMLELYRDMVTDKYALSQIAKLFRSFCNENHVPVLIHCSGGKDRTGLTCALLLSLLGVSWEDIMADYMLSLTLYSQRLQAGGQQPSQVYEMSEEDRALRAEIMKPIYSVEPAYLEAAFGILDEQYANTEDFFRRALGIRTEEIQQLQQMLLEAE